MFSLKPKPSAPVDRVSTKPAGYRFLNAPHLGGVFIFFVAITCLIGPSRARAGDNDIMFTFWGTYSLGPASSFKITSGIAQIGGGFDCAINDYSRFDLTNATLQFVGFPGAGPLDLELLAQDAGCGIAPLPSQSLFSLKRLRVGPAGISVRLVDNHDNGGGPGAEVLYVQTLAFEPSTSLDLRGRRVYYQTLSPANAGQSGSGVTITDSVGGGGLVSLAGAAPAAPTGVTATPNEICIGETTVDLSASVAGGLTVDWFLTSCGGTFIGTGNPLTGIIPTSYPTTTYYARAHDPVSGCVSSACGSVDVTVHPKDCTLTAEDNMCALTTAHVASVPDAGPGTSYTWTVTGGTITAGQGTRQITYTAGTGSSLTIAVTVVDGFNCTCNNSKIVTVYPNPVCTITAETDVCQGTGGHVVSVPVASPGPVTYAWTVTGGTITSGQNTRQITYTAGAGPTVTIDITITDGHNCLCTGQHIATLHLNPICTITVPTNVCNSSTGNIASVPDAGPGATYAWTLTGATITAGQNTRQITYTAGTGSSMAIDIAILDQYGCVCSGHANVTVNQPICTITSPNFICNSSAGNTASVANAGPGATYIWTLSSGTITAGQNSPSLTYTASSAPTITINVTVFDNISCTCNGQKVVTVKPQCTMTTAPAVCALTPGHTASVPVAAFPPVTYAWTVTGGTITAGQNTPTVTYTAGSGASATVAVTITDGDGCTCSSSTNVTINPNPVCTITAESSVCGDSVGHIASVPVASPTPVTYTWGITGGTITAGQNTNTITYSAGPGPSSLTLTINITDANGCVCSSNKVITVNQPSCVITANSPVCKTSTGNVVSVPNAGAGTTYNWIVTGGTITAGQGTRQMTYTAGTGDSLTLNVTVTDNINCTCNAQRVITVNPSCAITAESRVCHLTAGHVASVPVAINPSTYAWTITNGTITAGQGTRQITYTAGSSTTLTLGVTVTDGNGCACSSSFVITVNPPDCTITADPSVCNTTPNHFASVPDAGPGANYAWSITGGSITAGQGTRTITYSSGGGASLTINITVTDGFSCVCNGSRIVTVLASPPCSITADNIVCSNSPGHVASTPTAGTGATYVWSIINGSITAGQGTNTITYSATTGGVTLSVTVTDANGCISTCQRIVNMEEFHWIGADGGSFTSAANWSPTGIPGAGTPGGDAVLTNSTAFSNRCILNQALAHSLCALRVSASGAGKQILQIDKDISLRTDTTADITPGGEIDLRGGQIDGGPLTNAGNSLIGYGRVLVSVTNNGLIDAIPGDSHILRFGGSSFLNQATGLLRARVGSLVPVQSPSVVQSGQIEAQANASVTFDTALTNSAGALIRLLGGAVASNGLTNASTANIYGTGTIQANTLNNGNITAIANFLLVGNLANEGTVIIQSGILTVTGNLTGSGTLIGGFGGREAAGTLAVQGDLALATTDYRRIDLTATNIQMNGDPADGPQTLEAMAADAGPRSITLPDTSLYSIGALRIGPSPTTVQLADAFDNAPGTAGEAVYVNRLILDAGATLDLAGRRLYYSESSPVNPMDSVSGVRVIDSVGGGRLTKLTNRLGGTSETLPRPLNR